jgi:hypothetical protein
MTLRELWKLFDRGDFVDTAGLKRLLENAEAGESYLEARGEYLALFKTRLDIDRIKGYLIERGAVKVPRARA